MTTGSNQEKGTFVLNSRRRKALVLLLELILIIVWAIWVAYPYMDFQKNLVPPGGEYIMSLQSNYQWPLLFRCGSCFLWNGYSNGGVPAFIDTHGSWLHPISVLSTLIFGVLQGGKLTFILSLIAAGLAQLWLGKLLKVNHLVRLWGALVVVSSGHLAGKMEIASLSLVVSTAACSLVIPAALQLLQTPNYRNSCIFGVFFGCAILSGQGYLQITLIAVLVPFIGYLMLEKKDKSISIGSSWRWFLLGVVVAVLIASVLLVPLANHLNLLAKDGDPIFSSAQPLRYILLNLVIDDPEYHYSNVLGKTPYPYLSNNYIGWIPVLFAFLGLLIAPPRQKRFMIAAVLGLVVVYLFSSAVLLKWTINFPWPLMKEFIASLRYPGVSQGLAVPLVVALGMVGLDASWKERNIGLKVTLSDAASAIGQFKLPLKNLALSIMMVVSLVSLFKFARYFLAVYDEERSDLLPLLEELETESTQWVQPVFGEHYWLSYVIEKDMKIRWFFRPWGLKGAEELPPAKIELTRVMSDEELPEYLKTVNEIVVLSRPEIEYAFIDLGETQIPCQAQALGGHIDVICDTELEGILMVMEHSMKGWHASIDGERLPLKGGAWLSVSAPAGTHTYQFRYLPVDVLVGILLCIIGWILAILGILRGTPPGWLRKMMPNFGWQGSLLMEGEHKPITEIDSKVGEDVVVALH